MPTKCNENVLYMYKESVLFNGKENQFHCF